MTDFEQAVSLLPEVLQKDLEDNLCVCNEVPKRKVIETIMAGADSLERVRQQCYATDGNGCCKRQVQRLIESLCTPTVESSAGGATSKAHSRHFRQGTLNDGDFIR